MAGRSSHGAFDAEIDVNSEALGWLEGTFSIEDADPDLILALEGSDNDEWVTPPTEVEVFVDGWYVYEALALTSHDNALALVGYTGGKSWESGIDFFREHRLRHLIEDNTAVVSAVVSRGIPVEDFVEFSSRFPAGDAKSPELYAEAAALFAQIRGGGIVDDSSPSSAFAHAAAVLDGTARQEGARRRAPRPAPQPKRRSPLPDPSTTVAVTRPDPTLPLTAGDDVVQPPPPSGEEPSPWQAAGLPGFRNLRVIGSGGFADVLYGESQAGEPVAIKVLIRKGRKERDEAAAKLFQREARMLGSLRSDSIPRLISSHVDAPRPYFVMEYIDGEDIDHRVRSRGPMTDIGELLDLANSTADALADLHDNGYLHRDVTPHNVMASRDGFKLIDLGVGKDLNSQSTTAGGTPGTLAFMAPEYWRGEGATQASDVFSWGAVMGYAMTGLPPYGNYARFVLMEFVTQGRLDEEFLKALDDFGHRGPGQHMLSFVASVALRADPATRDLNFRDVLRVLKRLHLGPGFTPHA